jgi:hypothetical protein
VLTVSSRKTEQTATKELDPEARRRRLTRRVPVAVGPTTP